MHTRTSLLLVIWLLGCQPPVKDEVDGGSLVADAGAVDAGSVAQRPRCAPGFEPATAALRWVQQPPGPSARDHHATVIYATDEVATLAVVNGIDMDEGVPRFDAWFAKLDAEGFISAWVEGPSPLFWSAGAGVEGLGDRLYYVSGQSANVNTPRVQSLQMNGDGSPGAWREEPSLPGEGRFHITATRVGRWLFALGGRLVDGSARPEIFSARIGDDGALSAWTEARPFPAPRTHHASFAVGNRLVVVGGFDAETFTGQPSHYRDVLVATVDEATGALGEWSSQALPWDISTHAAAYADGFVYLVGGFDSSFNLLASTQRAPVSAEGTLGAFEALALLPRPRAHVHNTPVLGCRLYSVGGNIGGHQTQDAVFMGALE